MAEQTEIQEPLQLQPENQSSNRRIAKNAMMLYIRMFLTMVVGLYTSRVVLATLGVEDYGIYGVVGGVVAMMGFLNASMSGATSRFLTFELGRGDKQRLAETFSSALIVHIGIALVVFVFAETVGLWFLCNKLVIPEGRMGAAHWVYQCSILSAMLSITQVPYNASIIAHEKMDVYAYVEILHVTLKLLIVYLLVIGNFDKLKLYAILTLAVSAFIMIIYRTYCIRKFEETHFHWTWKKTILKPLLSFSGWDLYGNLSVTAYQQGSIFVINIFLGPILNAANNIAVAVNGIIKSFAYNVIQAFRPQIIKQYADGQIDDMEQLVIKSSVFSLLLLFIILVPVYFEGDYLLRIWLVDVPIHTLFLLRIILICCVFNVANLIINIPIHATGNIKRLSLWTGSCYIACPLTMYAFFKSGMGLSITYFVNVPIYLMALIVSMIILKGLIKTFNIFKLMITYGKCLLALISCSITELIIQKIITTPSFVRLFFSVVINSVVILVFLYFSITKEQRKSLIHKFSKRK